MVDLTEKKKKKKGGKEEETKWQTKKVRLPANRTIISVKSQSWAPEETITRNVNFK